MEAVLAGLGLGGKSEEEVREALRERPEALSEAALQPALLALVAETEAQGPDSLHLQLLRHVLALLPTPALLSPHSQLLLRCLGSTLPQVFRAALKELAHRDGVRLWEGLALQLVALLQESGDADAKKLLLNLSPDGSETIDSAAVRAQVEEGLKAEATVRFRLYDWLVEGSLGNAEFQDRASKAGLLGRLAAEVEAEDVLTQLNALELLGTMAAGSAHSAQLLNAKGLPGKLETMLGKSSECPDVGSFLFPALLRFFGHLARASPGRALDAHPAFARALWTTVFNAGALDATQRLLGLDTLALLGSSLEGRRALAGRPEMGAAMAAFGRAVVGGGPAEVRRRHLEALAQLLRPLQGQTQADGAVTKSWWEGCGGLGWEALLGLFRQAVPELRLGAACVVEALGGQDWGRAGLLATAGFLEFLLDRESETSMDGRHARFAIVQALLAGNQTDIDPASLRKLLDFRGQGVFFVSAPTQVATEAN